MTFSISAAANQAGISIHTLHYYEREGLLQVERSSSGHRRYSSGDLEWIGILIRTMREFAKLVQQDSSNIPERIQILKTHRLEVLARLKSLQHNFEHVEYKIDYYQKVLAQNMD
jgi:DNA-binding transcriptional MerR regulator